MIRSPVAALLVILAGCSSPAMPDETPQSDSSPEEVPLMIFSNCSAAGGLTTIPLALAPAEPPANWSRTDSPVTGLVMTLFQCERVGFGGLERGPLHILVEGHGNGYAPDGCVPENGWSMWALHALWVSDAEVAIILGKLGIPVRLAEFDVEIDAALEPTVRHSTWSWRVPDGEWSSVQAYEWYPTETTMTFVERYFWGNDTMVGYIDLSQEMTFPTQHDNFLVGDLKEPTLYAELGLPAYQGQGGLYGHAEVSGEIHRFGDAICKKPL
jgi:hypothetical protein